MQQLRARSPVGCSEVGVVPRPSLACEDLSRKFDKYVLTCNLLS